MPRPSPRHLAVLLTAALALVAGACEEAADPGRGGTAAPDTPATGTSPAARPGPTPPPSPSPTPTVVRGQARVAVRDIAQLPQRGVVPPGGGGVEIPPVSGRAVERFADALTDWLDAHLTAVQRGSALGRLANTRVAAGGDAAALDAVTTDLAGPRRSLARVRYDIRIYARGEPRWAHVRITTVAPAGGTRTGALLLERGDGGPVPLAAGPVEAGRG